MIADPGNASRAEPGARSQGSSPRTVGLMTLRDRGEQSLELEPGELPGVYELGEEADNYLYQCITSDITLSYHSRGLKITVSRVIGRPETEPFCKHCEYAEM